MTEEQDLNRTIMLAAMQKQLWEAAAIDPLTNYAREQDHFIKYAPKHEVDEWRRWNKEKREEATNQFHSDPTKTLRWCGSVPGYISDILTSDNPCYFDVGSKTRNAFFRRNPLFCVAEAV